MTKYEQIYEALCDAVDDGELSLEEAEVINDRAYDMYATEYSSFDKAVKKIHNYTNKDYDNGLKQRQINNLLGTNTKYEPKYMDNIEKLSKIYSDYDRKTYSGYDSSMYGNADELELTRLNSNTANSDIRNTKYEFIDRGKTRKQWQRANGDVGERPEEKYKPNRYLKAQEIKRSFR